MLCVHLRPKPHDLQHGRQQQQGRHQQQCICHVLLAMWHLLLLSFAPASCYSCGVRHVGMLYLCWPMAAFFPYSPVVWPSECSGQKACDASADHLGSPKFPVVCAGELAHRTLNAHPGWEYATRPGWVRRRLPHRKMLPTGRTPTKPHRLASGLGDAGRCWPRGAWPRGAAGSRVPDLPPSSHTPSEDAPDRPGNPETHQGPRPSYSYGVPLRGYVTL